MKIYLAGPLFTQAEQQWLRALKEAIQKLGGISEEKIEVVWPYELFSDTDLVQWGDSAKHEIFRLCKKHLDETDMVVALLDGTQVDDGTSWEIGYFWARKKDHHHILGIRTDFRKAGDAPAAQVNLMIDCSCNTIVHSPDELLGEIKKRIVPRSC